MFYVDTMQPRLVSKCLFVTLCLWVVINLNELRYIFDTLQHSNNVRPENKDSINSRNTFDHDIHQFKNYSSSNTETFSYVCFTNNPTPMQWNAYRGVWYAGQKKFILPCRPCVKTQKYISIYSDSPFPEKGVGFAVTYHPVSALPSNYELIENVTPYFLSNPFDFEPNNFYHFTKQIYFPLYWLIKNTNQLHTNAHNIVFYPDVYGVCPEPGNMVYYPIHGYQDYFHDILHIKNRLELSAYNDKPQPDKVCYKNAVFSSEIFLDKAAEAIEYVQQTLGIHNVCTPNKLVILNRNSYRRIRNVEELKRVGTKLGFDTKIVIMEELTLKEQAQLIHCTRILAGVTGAGLQWAFFMKNHSGVVEIAWPHQEWPFFFTSETGYNSGERDVIRPLHFAQVSNATCQLNPKAINMYHQGVFFRESHFSDKQALAILKDKRNYRFYGNTITSLGKLCDVIVDPKAFREALLSVEKSVKLQRKNP